MLFATFPLLLLIFSLCPSILPNVLACSTLGLSCMSLSLLPELGDCSLSHVREVFSYYIFKYFLGPFLSVFFGTPIMRILVHLMLSPTPVSSFILCPSGASHHSPLPLFPFGTAYPLLTLSISQRAEGKPNFLHAFPNSSKVFFLPLLPESI